MAVNDLERNREPATWSHGNAALLLPPKNNFRNERIDEKRIRARKTTGNCGEEPLYVRRSETGMLQPLKL